MPTPETLIAAFLEASETYARAVRAEQDAITEEPLEKSRAIGRLMQLPDPNDPAGADGKPMAATKAEKFVELDERYRRYRAHMTNTVVARIAAEDERRAARMRCLATFVASVEAGDVL